MHLPNTISHLTFFQYTSVESFHFLYNVIDFPLFIHTVNIPCCDSLYLRLSKENDCYFFNIRQCLSQLQKFCEYIPLLDLRTRSQPIQLPKCDLPSCHHSSLTDVRTNKVVSLLFCSRLAILPTYLSLHTFYSSQYLLFFGCYLGL